MNPFDNLGTVVFMASILLLPLAYVMVNYSGDGERRASGEHENQPENLPRELSDIIDYNGNRTVLVGMTYDSKENGERIDGFVSHGYKYCGWQRDNFFFNGVAVFAKPGQEGAC